MKHSKSLKLVLPILLILLMGIGILSGCFGNPTTPSPTVPAGEEKVLLRTTYKEINLDEGNFSIEICSLNQYGLNASGFNYIYYDSEGVEITELSNFIGIPFDVVPSTLIGSPGSPTEVNNIPLYFNEVENYFIANPDVKQISCTVNLIGTDSLGNEITELIMSNIPIIESGVEHQEVNAVIQTTPNPPTGEVPLTVSFDAGASTTEDARGVAKYCWHFGDGSHGTCFDCSCPSELECPMHTYEEPGTYIATLCVWDYNDNLDCAAVVVTVNALQMNMTITANPATIAPKETSTISAYLTDQYDNPIPDGTKVAFYTTDGTLSAVFADTVDGIATVVLTLNEPVIATVTAVCDDASGSIIVRAVELGITVTADPVTISPGDFSTISAYLVDTFGEPVPDDTTITFSTSEGNLSSNFAVTTAGIATVELQLSRITTAIVTANYGTVSGSTMVTCTDGPIAIIENDTDDQISPIEITANSDCPYTITFNAYKSIPGTAPPLTYEWTMTHPDGTVEDLGTVVVTAPYVFDACGIYVITLTVEDSCTVPCPHCDTATMRIIVTNPEGPTAIITSSEPITGSTINIIANSDCAYPVTFFGDKSTTTAICGDISDYSWTIVDPDGDSTVDAASGMMMIYSFDECGTYVVALEVTDDCDRTANTFVTVIVSEPDGPTAVITSNELIVDSVITITADSASPYSITFYGHESSTSLECGDITAYDWQIIDPGGIEVDTGIQLLDIPEGIKMVYNNFHINGNYSVKLMVTDGCGNTDSETLTVTCNKFEMNIEVAANPVTINPGASSTITAYVTKANGDPVDDGTTVIFSTTAGTLSGTSSITTAGIATIELILDHNGIAYVTATVDSVSATATVICTAYNITVIGNPATVLPGGSSTITAYVTDSAGVPVANGTQVSFYTSKGTLSVTTATTTAGIATTVLTLMQAGDSATVIAVCDACDSAQDSTVVTCADNLYAMDVSASAASVLPGGSSTITAYLTQNGAPLAGATVTFAITTTGSGSIVPVTGITTAGGVATTVLTLNQPGEVATVTATYASTSGPVSDDVVVICADNLYAMDVSASAASVLPGGSSTITAYLTQNGAPLAGATVTFAITTTGSGSIVPVTGITTAGGVATTVLTLNQQGEVATVTATYASTSGPVSDDVVVICADNLYAMDVSASAASVLPGGSSTITAYLTQNGAPLAGATVTFAITTTGSGSIVPVTGITTAGGVATTVLTLNQQGEVATVTATYASTSGPVSDDVVVICADNLYQMDVQASAASVLPGGSSTISAYLTQNGAPLAGATVTFAITTTGSGSIIPVTGITNAGGFATTVLTLNQQGEVATVTATYASTSGPVSDDVVVICADSLYQMDVQASAASVLPGGSSTISAYLTQNGAPLAGATVTFAITTTGSGSIIPVTGITNAGGFATTVLTLNQQGEVATVTATYASTSGPVSDDVVVICADSLYQMDVQASAASVLPNGDSIISAYLTQNGAPLTGATVTFAITTTGSGSIIPVTGITNAGGFATTVLTLNQQGEVATVTATYASTSGPVSDSVVVICADHLYAMDVSASAASVLPNGDSIISAYVTQNGAALAGVTVSFAITSTQGSGTISTFTATTGGGGIATTTLTLVQPGDVATVTGTYSSTSGPITDSVVVICADNLYAMDVSASAASVLPGGSSTITAYLTVNGAPIADGATVTFAITTTGSGSISVVSDTTSSGNAETILTLNQQGEVATVTATYASTSGPISDDVVVICADHLYAMDVSASAASVLPNGDSIISAYVTQNGAALAGVTVSFAITSTQGSGTISTFTATTGGGGIATTTLTLVQPGDVATVTGTYSSTSGPISDSVEVVCADSTAKAEWTVMVYMSGDNNLDPAAWNDLGEMEDVGSTAQVKIVAQLDPYEPTSCAETFRYYVTGTAAQGTSYPEYPDDIVQTLSEQDMADPSVLGNFVNWATTNYPADHYLLVFWNHGGGWREEGMINKGVMVDETSLTCMDMVDLADALDLINEHIDIIGFDACLMQMIEVAYQIESSVTDVPDYMVGSEDSEWNDGWPYDDFLSHLTSNPTMSAATLGETIVHDYVNSGPTNATLSLIDLDNFSSIADPIFDAFKNALIVSTNQADINVARALSQNYAHSDGFRIKDIYDFAFWIASTVSDCQSEAFDVMNFVDNVVVCEEHLGPNVANSHGLSIYLPDTAAEYDSAYDSLLFNIDTRWDLFLQN